MRQYLELVETVLSRGTLRETRTGVPAISTFGHMLKFDMSRTFPIVTAKRVPFTSVAAELVGFLRGFNSAKQFRYAGTRIWDANANAPGLEGSPNGWLTNPNRKGEDDLGRIYGVQWRDWRTTSRSDVASSGTSSTPHEAKSIDQISNLLDGLVKDPYGRRHLVTAWNPGELDQMALPPCHYAFQCYIRDDGLGGNYLDMLVNMRSVDVFLGLPFNISSYAALAYWICHMVFKRSGGRDLLQPGELTMVLGDTHIYANHQDCCRLMLARGVAETSPKLSIDPDLKEIDQTVTNSFILIRYFPYPAIPAPMAV